MAAILSAGQVGDAKGYDPLMTEAGPAPKVLIGDKAYDTDHIRQDLKSRSAVPVIPFKRNRKVQETIDGFIYALRNQIERCINKLKNARRLATRYDKTADSYLGFVHIVSIRLWIKIFVNTT